MCSSDLGNNPITAEQVMDVINDLNEKYKEDGLLVKNLTMYVRFQDRTGKVVEVLDEEDQPISHTYTFSDAVNVKRSGSIKKSLPPRLSDTVED